MLTDKKSDKFALFHAYQALIFGGAVMVVYGGLLAVVTVLSIGTGGLGSVLYCMIAPVGLIVLVAALFTAYKAFQGEKYMLPVIGEMATKYAEK
jgi:uncharacterized membrane protein